MGGCLFDKRLYKDSILLRNIRFTVDLRWLLKLLKESRSFSCISRLWSVIMAYQIEKKKSKWVTQKLTSQVEKLTVLFEYGKVYHLAQSPPYDYQSLGKSKASNICPFDVSAQQEPKCAYFWLPYIGSVQAAWNIVIAIQERNTCAPRPLPAELYSIAVCMLADFSLAFSI